MKFYGCVLIALGLIYVVKPNLFNRWFWKKTSIAQQKMSPIAYLRYMRILGIFLTAIGAYLLVRR